MSWRYKFIERFGPGGFSGATLGDWLRTLRRNRFDIDARYWPRAVLITLNSVANSFWRRWENFRYAARVRQTPVPPPLIVLGIWRSGTTHLHNLLAQDDRFAFPNTFQVFYPHSFLSTESLSANMMQRFMAPYRPMDNVKNGVGEPQEDEFALAACGLSYLIGMMAFPRSGSYYRRFLTLRDATPAEEAAWKSSLMWFLRKLTFKYDRPLVIKSPGHTCRIPLLLEMFPRAKFVHIRRDPYAVFQSSVHTAKKTLPFWALQAHEPTTEELLHDYIEVYGTFFEQREMIPAENYCEVAYEDLEQDPMGQLERIYGTLGLPAFDHVEPRLREYLQSIEGYKKNSLPDLPPELRQRLAHELSRCFQEWHYAK